MNAFLAFSGFVTPISFVGASSSSRPFVIYRELELAPTERGFRKKKLLEN